MEPRKLRKRDYPAVVLLIVAVGVALWTKPITRKTLRLAGCSNRRMALFMLSPFALVLAFLLPILTVLSMAGVF